MTTEDTLDSIFTKAVQHQSLFSNHEALQADYVPYHLPFRDQQIASIGQVLSPILHNTIPSNLLIYGKTGTGKTAVTKYVTAKLAEACKKEKLSVSFVYSNMRLTGTEYRTLAELASGIGLKIPFTGLALSEVLTRIQQHISKNSIKLVFILDEIDYLVQTLGDDLLYGLTTSADKASPGSVSLIGISNDLKFKERLGARVISRLSEEELVFPPYSADQLKNILMERAQIAFDDQAYSEGAVSLCAALSGSEHGDARRAVDLLRVAGEIAEREPSIRIEERHVRTALQKMDQDRVSEALRTLPLHAKLILIATISSSEKNNLRPSTGLVYSRYSVLCKAIGTEPLTTRRVSGLFIELDTLGLIKANIINYGRYGRTKKITSEIGFSTIREIFSQDDMIKELVN